MLGEVYNVFIEAYMATSKKKVSKKVKETKAKKEFAIKPTVELKHKSVIDKMVVNGGKGKSSKGKNKSIKDAAIEAGYSEAYAKSGKITKTKTWNTLIKEIIPEDKLLKALDQQLNSYKLNSMLFAKQIQLETIYELFEVMNALVKKIVELPTGLLVFYYMPDNQSRNKAIELGLKVHKKLTDKIEFKDESPLMKLTDEELRERIKKAKNLFLKK